MAMPTPEVIDRVQALHDHMTLTPPAQLRMDDTYLKQAAKATAVIYTKLLAAIDAQRQASAKSTRSAIFDRRLQKLSEKAQKKGTFPVIVKAPAAFRPEGQIMNAAEASAQCKVIEEALRSKLLSSEQSIQ